MAARRAAEEEEGPEEEEPGKPRGSGEQTPHENRQKPGLRLLAAGFLSEPLAPLLSLDEEEEEEPEKERLKST